MPESLRIYSMLRHWRKQRPHKSRHSHQKNIHKRNVARRIRIIHIDENRRKKKCHAVNNFMEKHINYFDEYGNIIKSELYIDLNDVKPTITTFEIVYE